MSTTFGKFYRGFIYSRQIQGAKFYCSRQKFQGLRLFKGVHLLRTLEYLQFGNNKSAKNCFSAFLPKVKNWGTLLSYILIHSYVDGTKLEITLNVKVRIFWEGHKIWKNLPLKIWRCSATLDFKWKISSNFVAFSEYLTFNPHSLSLCRYEPDISVDTFCQILNCR